MIEFFYNSGSLLGDELMKHLFNILSMMTLMEVRILGFFSDAGGNNTRLNKWLRNGKEIGNILWLKDEDVTFQDPSIFRKTMIATWLCSTHNLKSNRTQLNARSRTFLDKYDTPFNFNPKLNAHERDTKRSSKLTKLNLASTFLALWNKMLVSAVKILFIYETITEIFCHFGEQLQCQDDIKLNGSFDESKDNTHINYKRLDIINDVLQKNY